MSNPSTDPAEAQALDTILVRLISETNGLSLGDTLDLAQRSMLAQERPAARHSLADFRKQLFDYHRDAAHIDPLLSHPVALSLGRFLRHFPSAYREEPLHRQLAPHRQQPNLHKKRRRLHLRRQKTIP